MRVFTQDQLDIIKQVQEFGEDVFLCKNRYELKRELQRMRDAVSNMSLEGLPSVDWIPSDIDVDKMEEGGLNKMTIDLSVKASEYAGFLMSYEK